jgi:hypothetical protein
MLALPPGVDAGDDFVEHAGVLVDSPGAQAPGLTAGSDESVIGIQRLAKRAVARAVGTDRGEDVLWRCGGAAGM